MTLQNASFPLFRPQKNKKYKHFSLLGRLAVQMLWKTSFLVFTPSPLLNRMGKLSKHGKTYYQPHDAFGNTFNARYLKSS